MYKLLLSLIFTFVISLSALADSDNSIITVSSAHDVTITADRLEKILTRKGMTIFSRINHAKGAEKIGETLLPTELVIFGNPKVGAPLMQCGQSIALDLPQKVLIWQDDAGQTWLSYNDPNYLAKRHNIKGCEEIVAKMVRSLSAFAKVATM